MIVSAQLGIYGSVLSETFSCGISHITEKCLIWKWTNTCEGSTEVSLRVLTKKRTHSVPPEANTNHPLLIETNLSKEDVACSFITASYFLMNSRTERLRASTCQCHNADATSTGRQRRRNLIKRQSVRSVRHRSPSVERSSCFTALQTVGADAATGSGESSRKHTYKIAVMQECLQASW